MATGLVASLTPSSAPDSSDVSWTLIAEFRPAFLPTGWGLSLTPTCDCPPPPPCHRAPPSREPSEGGSIGPVVLHCRAGAVQVIGWPHPERGAEQAWKGGGHTPRVAQALFAGESSPAAAAPAVRCSAPGPAAPQPSAAPRLSATPLSVQCAISIGTMAGIAMKLAKDREAAEGLGSHERAIKYLNQDYETLLNECLEAGALFQDPSFPALPSSLGFKELGPYSSKTRGIEWKRPTVGSGRGTGRARMAWKGTRGSRRLRTPGSLAR